MTKEKETLQAKDIVGYIAEGDLKAITNMDSIIDIVGYSEAVFEEHPSFEYLSSESSDYILFNEVKPLLYPLSHLTKEIPFNGGTIVPLIECAKISFPLVNDFRFKHNFVKSDKAMISFYYEPAINSFLAFEPSMQDIKVPKQHALFQLLYQYKIDFLGLIDKGLAVDVSTLTVNPYL